MSCSNTHEKVSSFFHTNPPEYWSPITYLDHHHPKCLSPRHISNGWSEGLRKISNCKSTCCNDDHRSKAAKLLERFNEQYSSDKRVIRQWLWRRQKAEKRQSKTKAHTRPSIEAQNIYMGSVGTIGTAINFNTDTTTTTNTSQQSTADIDSGSEGSWKDSEDDLPEDEHTRAQDVLTATFNSQSSDTRWQLLSSGRTVESVMFEACMKMNRSTFLTSMAPSFVLDVSEGSITRTWFTDDEWTEIMDIIPPLPIADETMANSLGRFCSAKTVSELRTILHNTSFLPQNTPYSRDKFFDADWADIVVRRMYCPAPTFLLCLTLHSVNLWESPQSPLRSQHLEDWYTSFLWSIIFDHCLLSLTTLTVERKEVSCRATARRRNSTRYNSRTRARSGMKLDAVIRTVEDNTHEFGGVEVAKSDGGSSSSKNLGDTWKLCRALRDMLQRLHERVDHDDEATNKIQVVGMVCSGVKFQMMRMGCWKGMVSVLVRENPMEMPVKMDIFKLLLVISHVQRFKEVIRNSVEAVDRASGWSGGKEDLIRQLLYGPVVKEKKGTERLGLAPETP